MPNFSLQLQDWTKRPLSQIMLRYARRDTHYLLEIVDVLTAELKEDKKYDEAIRRSNKMCLTLYHILILYMNPLLFYQSNY